MPSSIQQRDIFLRDFRSLSSPILILGAAFSGKSELAIDALDGSQETTVLGTGQRDEPEMTRRIEELASKRPPTWLTIDVPLHLNEALLNLNPNHPQVLVDSLNQWMAALIFDGVNKYSDEQMQTHLQSESNRLARQVAEFPVQKRMVLVSSEVGASLSPNALPARLYRQATSRLNCQVASACRSVILVSAGIPLIVKALPQHSQEPILATHHCDNPDASK